MLLKAQENVKDVPMERSANIQIKRNPNYALPGTTSRHLTGHANLVLSVTLAPKELENLNNATQDSTRIKWLQMSANTVLLDISLTPKLSTAPLLRQVTTLLKAH